MLKEPVASPCAMEDLAEPVRAVDSIDYDYFKDSMRDPR